MKVPSTILQVYEKIHRYDAIAEPIIIEITRLELDRANLEVASDLFSDTEMQFTAGEYLLLLGWVLKQLAQLGPQLKSCSFVSSIVAFPSNELRWGIKTLKPLTFLTNEELKLLYDGVEKILCENIRIFITDDKRFSPDDIFEYEIRDLIKEIARELMKRDRCA